MECLRGGWIRNRITESAEAWSWSSAIGHQNNRLRLRRAYI